MRWCRDFNALLLPGQTIASNCSPRPKTNSKPIEKQTSRPTNQQNSDKQRYANVVYSIWICCMQQGLSWKILLLTLFGPMFMHICSVCSPAPLIMSTVVRFRWHGTRVTAICSTYMYPISYRIYTLAFIVAIVTLVVVNLHGFGFGFFGFCVFGVGITIPIAIENWAI